MKDLGLDPSHAEIGEGVRSHTPGPWVYRTGMPYDWGWVTDAAGDFIAQAKDPRANDSDTLARHRDAKSDPWEANARLIAAAPELRERLQAIIDWADFALNHASEFDSHGVRNLDGPVFDEAREVLKATTGGGGHG